MSANDTKKPFCAEKLQLQAASALAAGWVCATGGRHCLLTHMNTLQLGLSVSSLPSKVNVLSFDLTASWISSTCWATTDSTCTKYVTHTPRVPHQRGIL